MFFYLNKREYKKLLIVLFHLQIQHWYGLIKFCSVPRGSGEGGWRPKGAFLCYLDWKAHLMAVMLWRDDVDKENEKGPNP